MSVEEYMNRGCCEDTMGKGADMSTITDGDRKAAEEIMHRWFIDDEDEWDLPAVRKILTDAFATHREQGCRECDTVAELKRELDKSKDEFYTVCEQDSVVMTQVTKRLQEACETKRKRIVELEAKLKKDCAKLKAGRELLEAVESLDPCDDCPHCHAGCAEDCGLYEMRSKAMAAAKEAGL